MSTEEDIIDILNKGSDLLDDINDLIEQQKWLVLQLQIKPEQSNIFIQKLATLDIAIAEKREAILKVNDILLDYKINNGASPNFNKIGMFLHRCCLK
jgi:hypothetical protein